MESHLLRIPPELRLYILEDVLCTRPGLIPIGDDAPASTFACLQVCRLLRIEGLEVARKSVFKYRGRTDALLPTPKVGRKPESELSVIPRHPKSAVKHLELDITLVHNIPVSEFTGYHQGPPDGDQWILQPKGRNRRGGTKRQMVFSAPATMFKDISKALPADIKLVLCMPATYELSLHVRQMLEYYQLSVLRLNVKGLAKWLSYPRRHPVLRDYTPLPIALLFIALLSSNPNTQKIVIHGHGSATRQYAESCWRSLIDNPGQPADNFYRFLLELSRIGTRPLNYPQPGPDPASTRPLPRPKSSLVRDWKQWAANYQWEFED